MKEINKVLYKQLESLFFLDSNEYPILAVNIREAIYATEYCLSQRVVNNQTYEFNVFNTCDYMVFLYYLSHQLFLVGENSLADRVFYLNKMLNCVELFYRVELPKIWGAVHPLGAVMGRATYGEQFYFYQGCTVGANGWPYVRDPIIGNDVTMMSNSKIIGGSHIGNDCVIATNTIIIDSDIPDHSVVFGMSPNLIIKKKSEWAKYNYAGWKQEYGVII